ncbi:MAG: ubiquinone biosynthesis protein UbiA [Halobacteriales archaeon]
MGLARGGRGPSAVARAYLAKVHPVFMLPPVAAAAFGAILAGALDPPAAAVHVGAIFLAVYTAHLRDGYVDFYRRGEDDDTPLSAAGYRLGIAAAAALQVACLLGLYVLVDAWAVALTLPGWLIGYLHAPYLDRHAVTTTAGYPTGIALAVLGGHYVQLRTLSAETVALAVVLLVLLSGVKVVDDLQDLAWDRANRKRTVGVVLGVARAHRLAVGLMVVALAGTLVLAAGGVVHRANALAVGAFAPVLWLAHRRGPRVQTMLLIRGSYLFLAALVAVAWFAPT